MNATLVIHSDPFRPNVARQVHRITQRTRVDTLLRRHGFITGRGKSLRRLRHFLVTDGPNSGLLESDWSRIIEDGKVIAFVAVPAGGSALRTLALAAVTAAAIVVPGASWGLALSGWEAAAASVGISVAGGLIGGLRLPRGAAL